MYFKEQVSCAQTHRLSFAEIEAAKGIKESPDISFEEVFFCHEFPLFTSCYFIDAKPVY